MFKKHDTGDSEKVTGIKKPAGFAGDLMERVPLL
jgi:hypothetical protein